MSAPRRRRRCHLPRRREAVGVQSAADVSLPRPRRSRHCRPRRRLPEAAAGDRVYPHPAGQAGGNGDAGQGDRVIAAAPGGLDSGDICRGERLAGLVGGAGIGGDRQRAAGRANGDVVGVGGRLHGQQAVGIEGRQVRQDRGCDPLVAPMS